MSQSRQIISTATRKIYNKSNNQLRVRPIKTLQSQFKSSIRNTVDVRIRLRSEEIVNQIKRNKSQSYKNIFNINLNPSPNLQKFYLEASKQKQLKRITAQQDFINKLRRKQHKRSKHLLQRLQQNNQMTNLMQIFQKWKKSENQNICLRNRSQTIQQMKRRIRIKLTNCQSNSPNKNKSQVVSPFIEN